jgi:hypothetical protein
MTCTTARADRQAQNPDLQKLELRGPAPWADAATGVIAPWGQRHARPRQRNEAQPQPSVQLSAGYFDLATPFYQGAYEMHHLPIPASLQANIEYRFYESGHMVYAKDPALKMLHDNVAAFIRQASHLGH